MRFLSTLFLGLVLSSTSAIWAQSSTYQFVHSDDPLQDRLAYLLTVLELDTAARKVLSADSELEKIRLDLSKERDAARAACPIGPEPSDSEVKSCTLKNMILTDTQIEKAGQALERLTRPGSALEEVVHTHLRPSGLYQRFAKLEDSAFIRAAWTDTAHGINRLYDMYVLGKPSYSVYYKGVAYTELAKPQMFAPGTEVFKDFANAVLDAGLDNASRDLFFTPWAQVGIALLRMNHREDAARWEPLDRGENAAALARARSLNWKAYRYTGILVPGWGLVEGETGLAAGEAYTLRMAARRWREGLAPFIIFTGGQIHPDRTPYAPAVEAKRVLMRELQIPENAILVDPYARHTTTDLRNAERLLFWAGAPMERPFLVMSTQTQINYIASEEFVDRCMKERGFMVARIGERVSSYDLAVTPNIVSLQVDLQDPLDP